MPRSVHMCLSRRISLTHSSVAYISASAELRAVTFCRRDDQWSDGILSSQIMSLLLITLFYSTSYLVCLPYLRRYWPLLVHLFTIPNVVLVIWGTYTILHVHCYIGRTVPTVYVLSKYSITYLILKSLDPTPNIPPRPHASSASYA